MSKAISWPSNYNIIRNVIYYNTHLLKIQAKRKKFTTTYDHILISFIEYLLEQLEQINSSLKLYINVAICVTLLYKLRWAYRRPTATTDKTNWLTRNLFSLCTRAFCIVLSWVDITDSTEASILLNSSKQLQAPHWQHPDSILPTAYNTITI